MLVITPWHSTFSILNYFEMFSDALNSVKNLSDKYRSKSRFTLPLAPTKSVNLIRPVTSGERQVCNKSKAWRATNELQKI